MTWGLHNTGQSLNGLTGTPDADVDGPEAWALSTGQGVTVAVVDSGIQADHEDLDGQIATNPGETGGGRESNGVDDDGDGFIDNWRGWDFVDRDNDPADGNGHGTHVAGTIAALNGNRKGGTGLAPDAQVMAVRALGDNGKGEWSALAEGFDYAADHARIVNASLGGAAAPVQAVEQVIASHPDTLFVVAAGNDGLNLDTSAYYPCESPRPNVLCVGASDPNDEKADFSNYSPTAVDVYAPGTLIVSTMGSAYVYMEGTSMATPHVAAIAALMLARDPALTAAQLKQAIIDSAEPKAALAPYGLNGGRANARAAVEQIAAPSDSDGDGIPDMDDSCPQVSAPGTGDGCPPADSTPPVTPTPPVPPVKPTPPVPPVTPTPPVTPVAPPVAPVAPVPDCPQGTARTADGCLQPASKPILQPVKVTAPKQRCGSRACARTLKVTATAEDASRLQVTVTRKVCKRGKCAWKPAARAADLSASRKLKVRLAGGSYRVTVTATGPGGLASRSVTVRLR